MRGVERARAVCQRWEERLVQVGADTIAKCAEECEAVAQQVAALGEALLDRYEQLLLSPAAIEVVGPRRLAHPGVGERALPAEVPITFWKQHTAQAALTVTGVEDVTLHVNVNATDVVNERAEGRDHDHGGRVDLYAEHRAESTRERRSATIREEVRPARCGTPEGVDLWLPHVAVSKRNVHDVARN